MDTYEYDEYDEYVTDIIENSYKDTESHRFALCLAIYRTCR